MATPGPELRDLTGYLLRRAYVTAVGLTRQCLPPGSHVREVAVLAILAEQGAMSQRALSDVTHVNRTLIVKLIDGLEDRGWVVRDRDPDDRRSYRLRLTDDGTAALGELTAVLDKAEAQLCEPLSVAERQRLSGRLRALLTDDPALGVETLAGRCGYLVVHAHRLLRGRAEQALAELDLHPRDFGLLAALSREEPCSQNHLAAQIGVTPPVVLAFVDELGGRGLVTRSRNAEDRRLYDVTLTAKGRALLAAAQRVARGLQDQLVELLGAEGDADLKALLRKLIERPQ